MYVDSRGETMNEAKPTCGWNESKPQEIVQPVSEIRARPDCQAPNCENSKETAMVSFAGKWVCGDCAMKKQEQINAGVWG